MYVVQLVESHRAVTSSFQGPIGIATNYAELKLNAGTSTYSITGGTIPIASTDGTVLAALT
jgi:hypothetical protein